MPACLSCGADAGPETWRKWCRSCFAARKRSEDVAKDQKIADLEAHIRALQGGNPFGHEKNGHLAPERVRELLHLCHPDRHPGSALATKVTQWLLTLKR